MKYNCSHTFTMEADSRDEFDLKIERYSRLVKKASGRLDIGYSHGLVFGQPAADHPQPNLRAIADQEPEALFDE